MDFRAANEMGGDGFNMEMQNDEVRVSGDWGYARGTYSGNDKYLMVVRRGDDGEWRIAREIWNNNPN